ncbi:MAG: cysteine--tRNA ligase [Verrucomicrobiales bacterium]
MNRFLLYDTLSRQERALFSSDSLSFYCCGPTVYGPAHIGNFRTFLVQDLVRRVLEASGQAVLHVRNLTDVDDKTIRASQREGMSLMQFTQGWTEKFHQDCQALKLLAPHHEPGAVAHVPEQISLIEQLMAKGFAYQEKGSVYFKVAEFPNYGRLTRLDQRELRSGASQGAGSADSPRPQDADEYERESVADFVLWKAHKPEDGENSWESPWGPGRPGWHLECSAMCLKYCGEETDLHSGGADLVFPHHENEIAQSECATGKPFVKHWMHVAHLMVDGSKMSKSLGNLYTLSDVAARGFRPLTLRWALLSGHYRQPLNFTWESLQASESALNRLRRTVLQLRLAHPTPPPPSRIGEGPLEKVWAALWDDLNVAEANGNLFLALTSADPAQLLADLELLLTSLGYEELLLPEEVAPPDIQKLAAARWEAKQNRDFQKADLLRGELTSLGWQIKDAKDGYEIEKLE